MMHCIIKEPAYNTRTKQLDIKFHFIGENLEAKELEIEYKPTEEMTADAVAKALPRTKYEAFFQEVGMDHTQ